MSSCSARVTKFHDGQPLQGTVTASRCELEVTMLEPFPGLTARRRLCLGKVEYATDGQLTEAGRQRAEGLLADLFTLESWLRAALSTLERAIAAGRIDLPRLELVLRTQLRPLFDALQPLDGAEFMAARLVLRRDLRAGLDPRAYTRRLAALGERRRAATIWQDELDRGVAEVLVAMLPEIGPAPLHCSAPELLMPHLKRLRLTKEKPSVALR